jgi:uncharacterized protein (TIGR03067 family)
MRSQKKNGQNGGKMTKDIAELQGVWNFVHVETEGYTLPGSVLKGATMSIMGDHFISVGIGSFYEGTIAVDAAASPKTLDLNFTSGPEKGRTNRAIYEFNDEELRICMAIRGRSRPEKFTAQRGTGFAIEKLKRSQN